MINIAKIGRDLMIKEPFYGLYLLNLNKVFTTDVPTLAVGLNGINTMLYINEGFMEKLSELERLAVLKHELIHICMQHLTMRKSFNDMKLFNIAADIEINQLIANLPSGCLTLTTFPTITLPPRAGTKTYYQLLQENLDKGKDKSQQKSQGSGQESDSEDSSDSDNSMDSNGSGDGVDPVLKRMIEEDDIHKTWKEFDALSEEEKELVRSQIEHVMKETATQTMKTRGTIPGELKGIIDELFKINPPVFNWKAYFRRFLGYSNEAIVKKTMRKESKRFPQTAGLKIKFKQNILVGIDTSGSVSNDELCEFFSEIHHMYKAGVGITIQEFDCCIQRTYPYKGKWDGSISGRGGTDFGEFVDYYNAHKQLYTSAVIFTDGYAPVNKLNPHQKLMWVITSDGHRDNKYPGYSIFIPKK